MAWYLQQKWEETIRYNRKYNTFQGLIEQMIRWFVSGMPDGTDWIISNEDMTPDIILPISKVRELYRYIMVLITSNNSIDTKTYRRFIDLIINSYSPSCILKYTNGEFDDMIAFNQETGDEILFNNDNPIYIKNRMEEAMKYILFENESSAFTNSIQKDMLTDLVSKDNYVEKMATEQTNFGSCWRDIDFKKIRDKFNFNYPYDTDEKGEVSTYVLFNMIIFRKEKELFRELMDDKLKYLQENKSYFNAFTILYNSSLYTNISLLQFEDIMSLLSVTPEIKENSAESDLSFKLDYIYKRFIIQINILRSCISFDEYLKIVSIYPELDCRKNIIEFEILNSGEVIEQPLYRMLINHHKFAVYGTTETDEYIEPSKNMYFYTIQNINNLKSITFDEFIAHILPYIEDIEKKIPLLNKYIPEIGSIEKFRDIYMESYYRNVSSYSVKEEEYESYWKNIDMYTNFFVEKWNLNLRSLLNSIESLNEDFTRYSTDLTESKKDLHWSLYTNMYINKNLSFDELVRQYNKSDKYNWIRPIIIGKQNMSCFFDGTTLLPECLNDANIIDKYPEFTFKYEIINGGRNIRNMKNLTGKYLSENIHKYLEDYQEVINSSQNHLPRNNLRFNTNIPLNVIDDFINLSPEIEIDYGYNGLSCNENITIPWFIENIRSGKSKLNKWSIIELFAYINIDKDIAARAIQAWWHIVQYRKKTKYIAEEVCEWWYNPDCIPASRLRKLNFESYWTNVSSV
jgi:hypothetical protein